MAVISKKTRELITRLYRRFGSMIQARCRRILQDDHAAEDATQEIFLRAVHRGNPGKTDVDHLKWLNRVCTNYCLSRLRETRSRDFVEMNDSMRVDEAAEERLLNQHTLHQILKQLPDEIRIPAELVHAQGYEQSDIAQLMGVSRRTVVYRLTEFRSSAMSLVNGPSMATMS